MHYTQPTEPDKRRQLIMITDNVETQAQGVAREETYALLYLLEQSLTRFMTEVDSSQAMLNIGEKTLLVQQIESLLNNPLPHFFELSQKMDNAIIGVINKLVKRFFVDKNQLIKSAYRAKATTSDLYYAIVLKKDTTKNRSKVFDFFDQYDLLPIASKYPVYFQFVPAHLEDKLYVREKIDLDN